MSAANFALLITRSLNTENPGLFDKSEGAVYKEFELAESRHRANPGHTRPGDNLHLKFEKVRLGVAIALMQVFYEMSEDEDSRQILEALQNAAQANSIAQIDAEINKKMKAFDNLYKDLFINEAGEMLLGLFERILSADSKQEVDDIIGEALKLLDYIREEEN
ncbi:MAG: hypothetical protein COW65_01830 [Cytophagales bacterium CG18_big_fil_WC_8_21_14_2_50_42_9]|nr:MAG: hypothetical protein COW65_01830 [Cytophagales bacterium CG18_big_fil_WC_8_21_14_2_50_42_9]